MVWYGALVMMLAGGFALVLFLALVVGDWFQFTSLRTSSTRYGCCVARREDALSAPLEHVRARFDRHGLLPLPHGVAKLYDDQGLILVRPYYRLFSIRFRTAWPLKGSVEVAADGPRTRLRLIKRIPWSSALLTLLWFSVVGIGNLAFLITFVYQAGPASLSGLLMGLGIVGMGVLVLLFGLIIVALAYRLEDHRLMQVYEELHEALPALATADLAAE